MALKKPKGNMYPFIDWIWNPVRGECIYNCPYCYVKRSAHRFNKKQNPPRLIESELRIKLGINNYIFICSGCDLFAFDVPDEYINAVINRTHQFPDNKYLFQTKNPQRITSSLYELSAKMHVICTTIETNQWDQAAMRYSPVLDRAIALSNLSANGFETMVTIEPIMNFDLVPMLELIRLTKASQVNIGADTGNNKLPEPPEEKILELIYQLEKFTTVYQKKNLGRLLA